MTDDRTAPPLPPPPPTAHAGVPPGTPRDGHLEPANPDSFPRDRLGAMVRRTPAYAKLAWRLGKDPMLSKARRAAVVAAAGYLVSPVDLIPGFVPVLGQLDDLAFALAALRLALDGLHPDRRRMHLEAVGLEDSHLAQDLRTVGATTAWLVRRGVRVTGRLLRAGAHLAEEGAGIGLRSTSSVAGSAAGGVKQRLSRIGRRIHGMPPDRA